MEDEKKVNQNPQNSNGQGGRRRRHRSRHKGGHGQGQGQNNVNAQNQGAQNQAPQAKNGQNAQNQGGQGGRKGQEKQNAQNQQNNPNKQNKQSQEKQKQDKQPQKKPENRKDTYAYPLDGKLYLNLTNKCSNGCDFCVRNERDSYYGHYLWLNHGEVTFEKAVSACNGFGDLKRFEEIVFCGFGEPTYRMDLIDKLCDYFHEKGLKTRLNTNGQGSLINKRDIIPELVGKMDKINVSLNASCAENYQKICRSQYGENGFGAMVEFAKNCKRAGIDCRFSIVDCIGETEVESCKKLAQSTGVPLLIRKYIADC